MIGIIVLVLVFLGVIMSVWNLCKWRSKSEAGGGVKP
jgi:hypothetical protein